MAGDVERDLGELGGEQDQAVVRLFNGGLHRRGGMAVEAGTLALLGIGRWFRRRRWATVALVGAVRALIGAMRTGCARTAVFGRGSRSRRAIEWANRRRHAAPARRERQGEAANQGQQSCG